MVSIIISTKLPQQSTKSKFFRIFYVLIVKNSSLFSVVVLATVKIHANLTDRVDIIIKKKLEDELTEFLI
jgi:hypothetical protein